MSNRNLSSQQWKGVRTKVNGTFHVFGPSGHSGVHIVPTFNTNAFKWEIKNGPANGSLHKKLSDAKREVEEKHRDDE
jgi:hypothetical protein